MREARFRLQMVRCFASAEVTCETSQTLVAGGKVF